MSHEWWWIWISPYLAISCQIRGCHHHPRDSLLHGRFGMHRRCRMHRQVGKGHPWSLRGRWGCWRHSRQQPFGWQLAVGLRGLWPCGWQGSLQVHLRKGWEVQAMPCAHWAQGTHEVSSGHYQLLMAVASQLTKADQKSHDRRRF